MLSPPAAAGFAERELGETKIEDARAWAPSVLGALAQGVPREEILSRDSPLSDAFFAAAVRYGGALARHDPVAAPTEPPEARFLRDRLSEEDRKLVDDYDTYRMGDLPPPERLPRTTGSVSSRKSRKATTILPEYTNSILHRDELEDAVSLVSPTGRAALLDIIGPWDRRFEAATYPSPRTLRGSPRLPWKPRRWWWYRLPKRVGPKMARELSQLGFR